MPYKTKSPNGERFDDRIVVQVRSEFKDRYIAFCRRLGVNPSDHIRQIWEFELAKWESE